jgi:hypothetical protein
VTTEAAEAGVRGDEDGPVYYGHVIIEWPAPLKPGEVRALTGWRCAILNAATGKPVTTVEKIFVPPVTAAAQAFITCELTMLADDKGMPLLELERVPDPQGRPGHIGHERIYVDDDGRIRTGTFPFLVAEMRVRP